MSHSSFLHRRLRSVMRPWLALVALVLGGTACTASITPPADGTSAPRSMALVCVLADGTQAELSNAGCTDSRLYALVGGGSKGTLALATVAGKRWYDQDKAIPGYTPLMLVGPPAAIAVSAATQEALVLVPTAGVVQRVDLADVRKGKLAVKATVQLGFRAADLVLTDEAQPRVVLSDPEQGRLVAAPLAEVQASDAPVWQPVAVGGSPSDLAWVSAASQLWVGHVRHGYVSVLGGAGLQPVSAPLSLLPACRNGLDDDGDGVIDRADSGCDHENDDSEAGPEQGPLCNNGADDDADGQTDSADAGCQPPLPGALLLADACRNGVDDDGDGQTDYPADGGCSGWGDATEASENPGCANGDDDDDDGLTDGADPQCTGNPAGSEFGEQAGTAPEPPACSNGDDDDGDGLADLLDPDCYNRRSAAEVGADRSPGTLLTASLDGQWVVVVDRSARLAQVVDVNGLDWLWPVPGATAPWLRPSALDAVQRVRGAQLPALPLSVAPLLHDGRQAVAIGQAGGSVQILRLQSEAAVAAMDTAPAQPGVTGVHVLTSLDLATDPSAVASVAGLAELRLGTKGVDLGSTIPSRYAALAPTRSSGAGVTLTEDSNSHRSEVWRLTYEAELPGTARSVGHFVRRDQLLDQTADYCALGVLPGDWLLVEVPACGTAPAQTVRYPIAAVRAEALTVQASGGTLDVAVTADNQQSFDPTVRTPVELPQPNCFAPHGVRYSVRSGGWLVSGARTGLLSRRESRDGLCRDDTPFLNAARAQEPIPKDPAVLPPCPMTELALDASLVPSPLQHPVFSVQLRPGCIKVADGTGALVTKLLPSIRDAQWAFAIGARLQPVTYNLGAAPVVLQSAAPLARLYALDQGSGGLLGMSISNRSLELSLE